MTADHHGVRARPPVRVWLSSLFLSIMAFASAAEAQVQDTVPVPAAADTLPPDTVRVAIPPEELSGDTIPAEVQAAATSTAPVPVLPPFPGPAPVGWDVARWTWERDELTRLPGMTLLEFIERLPGFVVFRAGGYGRPAGLTALGMGGGRLRLRIDGYELDPHDASSFPLETLSLTDLSRVTVERTLSTIVVDVVPFRLPDPDPYSIVQMGTGVFETRLLRALFSRGVGSRSVATGAFDLATTGGIGLSESYATNSTLLRWSYATSASSGVEAEVRRTSIDRAGTVFPLETTRTDFVVRARTAVGERVTLEAFGGRSDADDDADTEDDLSLISTVQGGARAAYATERFLVRGGARARADRGPGLRAPLFEADLSALFRPAPFFQLETESGFQSGHGSAASSRIVASVIPHSLLTLFASAAFGSRLEPVGTLPEPVDDEPPAPAFDLVRMDASGLRGGVEVAGAFGSLGAAFIRSGTSPIAPFGLPFDIAAPTVDVDPINGFEVYFDIAPFPGIRALRADGWYTRWIDPVTRPYTPADVGRFGLTFHDLYIDGELEPFARLEFVRQGPTLMPFEAPAGADPTMPVYTTLNFDFRLRILDVQAFVIWDNLLIAQTAVPLADQPLPRPRIVYGASWRFRN